MAVSPPTPRSRSSIVGFDPDKAATHGRTFAEDLPMRDLNPSEAKVLSMAIRREPGTTLCSTWDITDHRGEPITVGFVARALRESQDDGDERMICRAMNWRSEREGPSDPHDYLAQRILNGLAQPGAHRALVDLTNWTLLKWLDDPAPFFDWRASMAGDHVVHVDDRPQMAAMAEEFATGTASGVLRMVANDGGWTPVHVTVNRVELERRRLRRARDAAAAHSRAARRDRATRADGGGRREKPAPARPKPRRPSATASTGPARATARAGPTPSLPRATVTSTATTTSSSSTAQSATAACIALATTAARAHAASVPSASRPAAARAARSAAA